MENPLKNLVGAIIKACGGQVRQVYFCGCGGSYAGLFPAKYFLACESAGMMTALYSGNEFCFAPPKAAGNHTVVITQSSSGTTAETVAAAKKARELGAVTVAFTAKADSPLAKASDFTALYGRDGAVANSAQAGPLFLAAELLHRQEGYKNYDSFLAAFNTIDILVAGARGAMEEPGEAFAKTLADEPLIYVMGSGGCWGVSYVYSMGMLQEMQWVHSAAIHSGEYFHGPFEITDNETPFIMLVGAGKTRPLDERALSFLRRFGQKIFVIDCAALGLGTLDPAVADYFSVFVAMAALDVWYKKLNREKKHPGTVRRYMNKLPY